MYKYMSTEPWLQDDNTKFKLDGEGPNDPEYLKELKKSNTVFDVIYNLFYHQSIEYINNHIRNVFKFNKNTKYLIIAHLNNNAYKNRKDILRLNLIINPVYYDKKVFTWQLTAARFENYQYLKHIGIKYNHMMLTVGTAMFIKQAPRYPPWKEKTLNKRPQYGHRVRFKRANEESVITFAEANTKQNIFTAKEQDYEDRNQMNNTIGVPAWFHMRDEKFKNKFLVPFFKDKGIFISIELINTWLCTMEMMEEMNKWFYKDGLFSFYKKEDTQCQQNFPLDELLFPTLSRHFDYYYCIAHNNMPHCFFPQNAGTVFKMKHPERFWQSEYNNPKFIKSKTKYEGWYMYKKINSFNELYKKTIDDLELVYKIDDNKLLKFVNEKRKFEDKERIRLAKYGLFPGQKCKTPGCTYLANTTDEYLIPKNRPCHKKFIGLCCQKCFEGSHGVSCTQHTRYPYSHEELLKLETKKFHIFF